MLDEHALGPAGRARGVDDVAEVVGCHRDGLQRRGCRRLCHFVEPDHRRGGLARERIGALIVAEGDRDIGVLDNALHAAERKLGIERHVAGAGLKHAEQGGEQPARLVGVERHQVAAPDAARLQGDGEAIGETVERGIGQCVVVAFERRMLGPQAHLRLEELVQQPRRFARPFGRGGCAGAMGFVCHQRTIGMGVFEGAPPISARLMI